jgi:hypothetical protein
MKFSNRFDYEFVLQSTGKTNEKSIKGKAKKNFSDLSRHRFRSGFRY